MRSPDVGLVRCGLCREQFASQTGKAEHLGKFHGARIQVIHLNGVEMFEYQVPGDH